MRCEHFTHGDDGSVYLNSEGMRIYLTAFYDKLDKTITLPEGRRSYEQIIRDEIASLTRHFKTGEEYKPFMQVK